ncbi:DUF2628 domain-containing protein [Brenneria sp. 4F2]|nr:DUF2628 domain-containing protein [Brenneria bubanii]
MHTNEIHKYSEKWNTRFAFFEQHGAPKTKEYKAAIRKEKFFRRYLFNMNFIAFFFGFIYFFILGLWRKNLSLLAIAVTIDIIITMVEMTMDTPIPRGIDTCISIALASMWASTANYAYYLKERRGSKSWNPFEGML